MPTDAYFGAESVVTSLHGLQQALVNQIRDGDSVGLDCADTEDPDSLQVLHQLDAGKEVVHVDNMVLVWALRRNQFSSEFMQLVSTLCVYVCVYVYARVL